MASQYPPAPFPAAAPETSSTALAPEESAACVLAALPLFDGLGAEVLERLARHSQLLRFARGDTVLHCGQALEGLPVVVSGHVKLHAISSSGQEKVIGLVGAGRSFCEATLFGEQPCVLNATALERSVVLMVSRPALLEEIGRTPSLSLRLLSGMSEQVNDLLDDVQSYALHSGTQRVIHYLLRDSGREAGEPTTTVALPVSKATLASRLSITPEYFSRLLGTLETERMIKVQRRAIHILDPQRLALSLQ